MKRVPVLIAIVSLGLVSLLHPGTAAAQDPVKVAPDIYKQVFENERVRVLDVRLKAGGKVAKHSHPDHIIYVLDPGKGRFSKPDGTSSDADFQVGQVVWGPAETHWAENIGSTEVHALVVELKERARAKPAPKKK